MTDDSITITEYQRRRQEYAERIASMFGHVRRQNNKPGGGRPGMPVSIGGVRYPSMSAAAKCSGVSEATFWRRLRQTKGKA